VREPVDRWTALGLRIQVGGSIEATDLPFAQAALELLGRVPPLGLFLDLARILEDRPFRPALGPPFAGMDAPFFAYTEHFIGRLRADPRVRPAQDAMLRLPLAVRPRASAVLASLVFRRLGWPFRDRPLGPVRRTLERPSADWIDLPVRFPDDETVIQEIAADLTLLTRSARQAGLLLRASDVFVLENFAGLAEESQRLMFAAIADAADLLEAQLPARIASRRPPGPTPTRALDESTYPSGGYASVSTAGAIESLLPSELVHIEPEEDIDRFDVRFAEGELLKFTRDESIHVRPRRKIGVRLSPDLARARLVDRDESVERLVSALALVVALFRRIFHWLEGHELELFIVVPSELEREGRLLEMLLRDASVRVASVEEPADDLVRLEWTTEPSASGPLTLDIEPWPEPWAHALTGLLARLL